MGPDLYRRGRVLCRRILPIALLLAASGVFVSRPAGADSGWSTLYVENGDLWLSGDQPQQLTQLGNVSQPAVSADAFAYVAWAENSSDLYMAGSGQGPHAITHNASSVVLQNHWAAQPVFLAKDPQLYALSDSNKSSTGVGDLAIWELDPAGDVIRQITRPDDYTGGDQDVSVNPLNDQQMIFTRHRYDARGNPIEELDFLDRSNGAAVPLSAPETPTRQAAYSPDGTHIAFVQTELPSEVLYVAALDTSSGTPQIANPHQVATGVTAMPVWRPDGGALAYMQLTKRRFEVFSVPLQASLDSDTPFGAPQQLTNEDGVDATSRPVWMTSEQIASVKSWLLSATS